MGLDAPWTGRLCPWVGAVASLLWPAVELRLQVQHLAARNRPVQVTFPVTPPTPSSCLCSPRWGTPSRFPSPLANASRRPDDITPGNERQAPMEELVLSSAISERTCGKGRGLGLLHRPQRKQVSRGFAEAGSGSPGPRAAPENCSPPQQPRGSSALPGSGEAGEWLRGDASSSTGHVHPPWPQHTLPSAASTLPGRLGGLLIACGSPSHSSQTRVLSSQHARRRQTDPTPGPHRPGFHRWLSLCKCGPAEPSCPKQWAG